MRRAIDDAECVIGLLNGAQSRRDQTVAILKLRLFQGDNSHHP